MKKDVVVVGSGGAGLTAALFAARSGLDVLLVEKAEVLGGTLAWSGGGLYLPLSSQQRAGGFQDSRAEVLDYLDAVGEGAFPRDIIETYVDACAPFYDALVQEGQVNLVAVPGMGDWYPELSGAKDGGRSLMPLDYDGKKLGRDLSRLRTPLETFNAPGGFMVSMMDMPHLANLKSPGSLWYMAKLFGRFLVDKVRFGRGTRLTMGNAVAAGMLKSVLDAGVEVWTKAPMVDLIREGDRIAGIVVERDGKRIEIAAARGVVLASGGFSANEEMRKQYIPYADQHYSLLPPGGNVGDGIKAGVRTGGVMPQKNLENGGWVVVSRVPQKDGSTITFPHLVADRPKPGCIAVDRRGERFANEASMDMVAPMHTANAVPSWFVCDAAFIKKYGMGPIRPGGLGLKRLVKAGYLVEAPSIEALAEKLGIDPAGLARTVARNNEFAASGVDLDFGKGRHAGDRMLGDPAAGGANPNLGPIAKPAFYGLRIYPGDSTTTLGLRVDKEARVLDGQGKAIEGLYAAGLDMNSIFLGRAPGGGANNGPAMVFGYIAAQSLARGLNSAPGDRL